jgi:CAAX prenyl protease-like protein
LLPRILPFALFMAFIAVNMSLDWFADGRPDAAAWKTQIELWLYPVRTILVLATLIFFWSQYEELKEGFVSNLSELAQAIGVGVLVYFLWVRMDWPWATQGVIQVFIIPLLGAKPASCWRRFVSLGPSLLSLSWKNCSGAPL